jgi:enamine deaminase RidA (YjgF/YER057c/UK114 family)
MTHLTIEPSILYVGTPVVLRVHADERIVVPGTSYVDHALVLRTPPGKDGGLTIWRNPLSKLSHPKPEGVAPGNGYSHVVTGPGRWAAIAGQVSLDADGKLVGEGDPEAQARQVFANLERCLAAAGATFADVVKLNFYVTDIAFLPAVRTARDEHIDTTNPPASTAVQVVSLFRPEALIEIEAYAVVAD